MLKPFNGGQVPCQTAFCLIFSVQNFPTDKAAALIGQSSACALVAGGVQIRADGKRQVFRVSGKKKVSWYSIRSLRRKPLLNGNSIFFFLTNNGRPALLPGQQILSPRCQPEKQACPPSVQT